MLSNSTTLSHNGRFYAQHAEEKISVFEMVEFGFTLLGEITDGWLKKLVGDQFVPMDKMVQLSGDGRWLFIGASGHNYDAEGLSIAEREETILDGCVYVFKIDQGKLTFHKQLFAPERQPGNKFGYSICCNKDGSVFAVGAPGEYRYEGGGEWAGAVFMFHGVEANRPFMKLVHTRPKDGHRFGECIDMDRDGRRVVIYAESDSDHYAGEILTNTDRYTLRARRSGNVHVFDYDNARWLSRGVLQAESPVEYGLFGKFLNLSGDGKSLLVFENNLPNWQSESIDYDNDIHLLKELPNGDWGQVHSFRRSLSDRKLGYSCNYINYDGSLVVIPAALNSLEGAFECGVLYVTQFHPRKAPEESVLTHPSLNDANIEPKRFGVTLSGDLFGERLMVGAYLQSEDLLLGRRYRFHTITIE